MANVENNKILSEEERINLEDVNIKFAFGSLLINIVYIKVGVVPKHISEHFHSKKSYEFHYILNGEGTCISDSIAYKLEEGIIYMTGPNIKHEQLNSDVMPMSEFCICFEMSKGLGNLKTSNDFEFISDSLLNNVFWYGYDKFNIGELCRQTIWELKSRFIGYQIAVRNLIEQLLISLARNYLNGQKSNNKFAKKNLDDKRLAIIEESFFSKYKTLTINSLAEDLGLSCRQTQRYVKAFYDTSFTNQLMLRKLTVAVYLLTQTDMKITNIANETGFNTLEQFCVCFKKKYGVTAMEYRNWFETKFQENKL